MRRCCECRMALRIRSTFRQSGSDLSLVSSRGDARRSRSSLRWPQNGHCCSKIVCSFMACSPGESELRTAAETRTKQIRAARVFALREAIREELRELVWRQGSARRARTPSFERLLRFEVASQLLELALIRHGFDWRGTRDRHNRRSGWRTVGV